MPNPRARLCLRDQLAEPQAVGPWCECCGPTVDSCRDPDNPRNWAGLCVFDCGLLERFIGRLAVKPISLHTHVPVGRLPALKGVFDTELNRLQVGALWPRRIDALLEFADGWWLVEAKRDANHYVLGQVLCYREWLSRGRPELLVTRTLVVTDKCDADVVPVLEKYGIEVVEIEMVQGHAGGRTA